jgi:superfamily II DNA or RNA helicase
MTEQLLPYQLDHVERLVYSLTSYNRVLDLSNTGTGKTYTSVATCKIFGWKPFIICPKSVITPWLKVLTLMKCDFVGITNYESFQNCKYYDNEGNKVKAKFLKIEKVIEDNQEEENNSDSSKEKSDEDKIKPEKPKPKYIYKWIENEIPNNVLFIFDEVHRCKNIGTNNGRILEDLAKLKQQKILLLSATVVDKPKYFILTGFVLGLYSKYEEGRHWIKKVGINYENPMQGVNKKIFPEYASRMKINQIKNVFPDNHITAECVEMDNAVEIQKQYEIIKQVAEELKNKEEGSKALAKLMYARQKIEILKIPCLIDLTKQHIKENKSVVIFVNFTETLKSLAEKLNTKCLIYGEQTMEERDINIASFNADKDRICICNIRSGGCGISLNDLNGNFPRVSLISPTWSAQDLVQCLGRIYRAKTKTKVIQRIIFCNKTVEVQVRNNVADKIYNIGLLNDGDMSSYKINGLVSQDVENNNKQEEDDNSFENMFNRLNKLYEKRDILTKEMELVKKEIETTEQIIQSQLF